MKPAGKKLSDAPEMISGEKLCTYTGLSDRRHRQLAAEGYFPVPVESMYDLGKTVSGIIRYYREAQGKSKLNLNELKAGKLERENKKLDFDIERISGQTVGIAALSEFMLRVSTKLKIRLYQFLEKEMPARAKVDPETAARLTVLGRNLADEMCETLAAELGQWNDSRS